MATSDGEDGLSRSPTPEDSGAEQGADEMSEQQQKDGKKSTSNSKDPNRPRRKKARRACFACQRAHLTCGMFIVDPI